MEKCQKCAGDGIIGGGPQPWLKLGKTSTCDDCKGTGKPIVEVNADTNEAVPAETVEKPVETLDNAPVTELPADSIANPVEVVAPSEESSA